MVYLLFLFFFLFIPAPILFYFENIQSIQMSCILQGHQKLKLGADNSKVQKKENSEWKTNVNIPLQLLFHLQRCMSHKKE